MNLPSYIDRPGGYDAALRGPYLQEDVSMRGYVIAAGHSALAAMCDRYLNAPAQGKVEYRPFASFVTLVFADMRKVSAGDPTFGSMREIDVGVFVPVLRYEPGHLLPSGMAVFMPYLFVSNDWALITGREGGLGFRKNLGLSFTDTDEDVDAPGGAERLTHVDAWTIKQRGAASRLGRQRLIELSGDHRTPPSLETHAHPLELLRSVLGKMAGEVAADVLKAILQRRLATNADAGVHIPIVFLKQMRDAHLGAQAVVQEVFEANGFMPLRSFRGGRLLGGQQQVRIANPASHPIADEIGVTPDVPLEVKIAFEVDCDFSVGMQT